MYLFSDSDTICRHVFLFGVRRYGSGVHVVVKILIVSIFGGKARAFMFSIVCLQAINT